MRHVDLLSVENESQSHYFLIKDFNRFIYNQTLYDKGNVFSSFLQSFSSAEILKRHSNDSFKVNDKQMVQIAKNVTLLNSESSLENKSFFLIYGNFKVF